MIKIGTGIDVQKLANDHWNWLSKKIRYNEDETVLQNEEPSTSINKILALRNILGPRVYARLKEIIVSPLDKLIKLKSDDADLAKFFPPSKEELDLAKNEYDEVKQKWQDKLNILKEMGKSDRNYKSVEKEKKTLNDEKKRKKKVFEEQQAKYDKKYKKYLNTITRKINVVKKEENESLTNGKKKGNKKPSKISVDLEELLCYGRFHDSADAWNANVLCDKLKVSVCPYCNRQYISVAEKNGGGWVSSAQIDHFLPKSMNPLFSCSFFNLIPSCYCCNHGKLDNAAITIYPYTQEFGDDGLFCLDYIENGGNIDALDLGNLEHMHLHICVSDEALLKDEINNSISVFHLNELYQSHYIEIRDLINRYRCFKKVRLDDCKKLGEALNESDKKKMQDIVLGFPLGAGDSEYPFRKMKKDLFNQLKNNDITQ